MNRHDHEMGLNPSRSYQTSIVFGCASRTIQYLNKTSLRLCWYHLGSRNNITLMHDLQVLQNKAAKVILDLPNYASSTDALKTLVWPTLFQDRLVHRYVTTFKYIDGLVDHNFNILRNSDIHSYNTRRRTDFRLPLAKRNCGK